MKIYNCFVHCNMNVSDLNIFRQVGDSACGSDVLNCPMPELNEFSSDVDISLDFDELNIILYVSGYIVHCFSKRNLPSCCPDLLCCDDEIEFGYDSEFLNICNRGGLTFPTAHFLCSLVQNLLQPALK